MFSQEGTAEWLSSGSRAVCCSLGCGWNAAVRAAVDLFAQLERTLPSGKSFPEEHLILLRTIAVHFIRFQQCQT